ncbi:MAG: alpha/beta fold hydrolase [Clostridia bacterium]|nr:alpha/beta fold hydrolase [Clostridia bacterium]
MKKILKWFIPLFITVVLAAAFFIYTGIYCRAGTAALSALKSDDTVTVVQTAYGWLFDGPSESDALIFYPGGKVEETAYAPLLHRLAAQGMDICLVRMPLRLAIFGKDKAKDVMAAYNYENWYIGGHSLGGVMAGNYAAEHPDRIAGVVLLAAYPTKKMDNSLKVLSIYGSQDGVINMKAMEDAKKLLPEGFTEYVIEGGNHAQFADYGEQRTDGKAAVTAEEQIEQTVEQIIGNKKG